jgi:hypothetical protein
MEKVSILLSGFFILTTFLTVWFFFKASGKSKTILAGVIIWMIVQAIAGVAGFFRAQTMPPRFLFLIGPAILFIISLFFTRRGRHFIDTMNLKQLTLLHSIRLPVEIVLYFLLLADLIPDMMTFEGNNFDILSGLTAPVIYYIVFVAKKGSRKLLLVWNFLCLGLLINVVTIAILAAQTPFQRLAFDHPNIGVTYFPFVWLPGVVVPIVLFSHLAAIRQLTKRSKEKKI